MMTVPDLSLASRKMKQLLELGYCKATAIFDTVEHMVQRGYTQDVAREAADEAHKLLTS